MDFNLSEKAKENIKPEQYDELLESAKKEAKETLDALAKEKEEIDAYEKQLNDLDEQINGGDEKDKEIKKLNENKISMWYNKNQHGKNIIPIK